MDAARSADELAREHDLTKLLDVTGTHITFAR